MGDLRLWSAGALATAGVLLALLAAIGVVRMPDPLTRMHASSKAGTLAAALVLAGVAVDFADPSVTARAVLVVTFLLLTAPTAAHAIARAGYRSGTVVSDAWSTDDLARDTAVARTAGRSRRES